MTPSTPGSSRSRRRRSLLSVWRKSSCARCSLSSSFGFAMFGNDDPARRRAARERASPAALPADADPRPLVDGGQERAAVVLGAAVGRRRIQRDEARQVPVGRPEAVERPRPERRAARTGSSPCAS